MGFLGLGLWSLGHKKAKKKITEHFIAQGPFSKAILLTSGSHDLSIARKPLVGSGLGA